jgi:hypothetical protein
VKKNNDGSIGHTFQSGDPPFTVGFRADDVRREHTGIHARVSILFNRTTVAFDTFNVGRDPDRGRLVNSAYKDHLTEDDKARLGKSQLKHEFDLFCGGLWDFKQQDDQASPIHGDLNPSQPASLLHPYILERGGSFLFGPPSRAKSWMAQLMAVSIDEGLDTVFQVQRPAKALYVNLERSKESMSRRLGQVNQALGLARGRPLLWRQARGRALVDILSGMQRDVEKLGVDVIFFDSISRAGAGDLNSDRAANAIVDGLNSTGAAWLGIAHSPRGDDSHIFGSMHFEAGADVNIRILGDRKSDTELGVGLQVVKANDLPPQPMQAVRLQFDLQYGLIAAVPARVDDYPGLAEEVERTPADMIYEVLGVWKSGSVGELAKEIGAPVDRVSAILVNDARFIPKPGTKWWMRTDRQGELHPLRARAVAT